MLSAYRVLDLADDRGLIAGMILADLGADVIAVEPRAGNPARRRGPFVGDAAGIERSLTWQAFARNKRSMTIDLESGEGRARLRQLVVTADVLIESATPGAMAARGLGHTDLAALNPKLVYVSISPFGQDGPKANWAASDLTVSSASNGAAILGDEDRAPLRFGVPQAFLHAGAEAAQATLIALRERKVSGRGQLVDVSAQQAQAQAVQSFLLADAYGDPGLSRTRGGVKLGAMPLPLVWEAADGHISLTFLFGAIGPFSRLLMEWIHEEGMCDANTRDKDWIGYMELLASGEEPLEEYLRVLDVIRAFLRTKTKTELMAESLTRRLLIVPIATMAELHDSEQFAARGFWHEVEAAGSTTRYPGAFARFTQTPIAPGIAPTLGQHDAEFEAALGRTPDNARIEAAGDLPLSDVKVLDFMWVMAGPASTRVMADYGATIVKVESTSRVDTARGLQPFKDGQPGADNSGLYQNMNAGKLGLTLDLANQEGREIARDLVRWADVVTEAFSPGQMAAWDLDYESLRAIKPDLIMLSTCLFGQSGPHSSMAGFGTMGAAAAGFNSLIGWPDREPAMAGAYSDYVAPRFTLAAILAALEHRDRSGEGQYIDLAQSEASMHFLAPALLDYAINGREFERMGNRDPQIAPHGVYPAAGDDRWVAIATETDEQWRGLAAALGREDLASAPEYASAALRLERVAELDTLITAWTGERDWHEIEQTLQAAGVPAHITQNSPDTMRDPQLLHRGHFVTLEHDTVGEVTVEGSRFRLSRTPARIERAAPSFGRDNLAVLSELLGYDAARIADLAAAGVLQ